MKLFDFPDTSEYRLSEVRTISPTDRSFLLKVSFQKIIIHHGVKKIYSKFIETENIEFTTNVCNYKFMIIGSIWQNGIIVWNDYLKTLLLPTSILEFDSENINIRDQIKDSFLPLKEENTGYGYAGLTFNVETKLYLHLNEKFNYVSESVSDKPVNFITFINQEIWRYFYSGFGNFNEALFNSRFHNSNKLNNLLFDEDLSKTEFDEDENKYLNKIFLKSSVKKCTLNYQIAGNINYLKSYKRNLFNVSNNVFLRRENTFANMNFPVDYFNQLKVRFKSVQNRDGQWGLLIFEIINCSGYTDLEYTPREKKPKPSGGDNGKGSSKPTTTIVHPKDPLEYNPSLTDRNLPEVEIESNDFYLEILNSELNVEVKKSIKDYKDDKGKGSTVEEKKDPDGIGDPSNNGDKSDTAPPKNVPINALPYFKYFPEIVHSIKNKLYKKGKEANVEYFDHNFSRNKDHLFIKAFDLNLDNVPKNEEFYVVEINFDGKYFYIFEKNDAKSMFSNNRTNLFYIKESLRKVDETKFGRFIQFYFRLDSEEKYKGVIIRRFNHQVVKETIVNKDEEKDKGPYTFISFSKDEAIEKHSSKIFEYLLVQPEEKSKENIENPIV